MTKQIVLLTENHHGENLRRIREILGLKQETLALVLNMPQQVISRWESRKQIHAKTLQAIERVLNLPENTIERFDNQSVILGILNAIHEKPDIYKKLEDDIRIQIPELENHFQEFKRNLSELLNCK